MTDPRQPYPIAAVYRILVDFFFFNRIVKIRIFRFLFSRWFLNDDNDGQSYYVFSNLNFKRDVVYVYKLHFSSVYNTIIRAQK